MRRRTGFLAIVLPALALGWPWSIAAKEAAPPAAAPAVQGREAVAPADIPTRADLDERFADEVVQRSQGLDNFASLEKRLDALGTSVLTETPRFKRGELRLLSIDRLESLERHWRFYGKELDQWRRDLVQSSSPHTEDAAELARRRAAWEATRTAAESAGMAAALSNRIQTVLAGIGRAERAVSVPIERQIDLSRRANSIETSVVAGQNAVAAAIAYNDSRLSRIDSPPIWELWGDPQASAVALKSVRTGLAAERRFLEEYRLGADTLRRVNNTIALAMLPLLLWLGVRSRRVASDDPEITASMRVLRRPISSWLVLIMVSMVFLEPDAPMLLHQGALLLALVPVLRLLPPSVYKVLGPWPYIATALYLLQRLSTLLVASSLYFRSFLLGLTLLAAGLLAWALWQRRPRGTSGPLELAHKVLLLACWAAVVALLVAAVANLVGNVSLAEMLVGGILESGYVGLLLYAGVTVLSSVTGLLLARSASSRFRLFTQHAGPLLQGFTRLLRLGALLSWIIVVLNEFRILRPIKGALINVLTFELKLGQIALTLGGVLLFTFSVWLAFWAAKTVRVVLRDDVLPKMSLPRGVGNSISSLTYYAVLILGLFVALAAAGFQVSQLAFVVGALGVGIGFGLQNVVNNFVSGLILMFERPIQPGDVIEIGATSGKVLAIGMRATTLSTFEGADVVVPNGILLNEKLVNWTLRDTDRRIDVNLGVAYGTDPRKVLELLMEVTKAAPGIATVPEPAVLFVGLGAGSLDFAIRAWTDNFGDWVTTRSELTVRVYEALRHAGIEIPFPQRDLHLRSVAPAASAALAGIAQPPEPRTSA